MATEDTIRDMSELPNLRLLAFQHGWITWCEGRPCTAINRYSRLGYWYAKSIDCARGIRPAIAEAAELTNEDLERADTLTRHDTAVA